MPEFFVGLRKPWKGVLHFGSWVQGLGFRVWGFSLGFRGFRVHLWLRVQGLGCILAHRDQGV